MGKRYRIERKGETAFPEPHKRGDGELYARPDGDPPEFWQGYEDGLEDRPKNFIGTVIQQERYLEGYALGEEERLELDRTGSSNA